MPLEQSVDEENTRFRVHPYPGILALGILLLEIELGRPIEYERPTDSPNNDKVFHIDADRPVAMDMLEQCRDDSPVDFVSAVEVCLDDKTFTDEFGRDGSYDDPAFRRRIFELIVKPLEEALQKIFQISVEKLDALPSAAPSLSNVAGPQRRQLPSRPAQMALQVQKDPEDQMYHYDDSEESGIISGQTYVGTNSACLHYLTTSQFKTR